MDAMVLFLVIGMGFLIYYSVKDNVDRTPVDKTPFVPPAPSGGIKPETEAYLRQQKYTTYFCVVGVQYYDYDIAARKRLFKDATIITLKREPKNRKDSNAIAVYFADLKVGYVPYYEAAKLAPKFDEGDTFTAYLEQYKSRGHHDDRIEIELVNETIKEKIESNV